jgi:hypothetical protein
MFLFFHHISFPTSFIVDRNFSHSIGDKLPNQSHNLVHLVKIVAQGINQTAAKALSYHCLSIL